MPASTKEIPGLHEAAGAMQQSTLDAHRAYRSLIEELEAIDWYSQRIDASGDAELKEVLTHNRDEEKEHAAMVLEWLRRRDPVLDGYLRRYLFADAGQHAQSSAAAEPSALSVPSSDLGIGDLARSESGQG
jgi:ferritin-like protein